MFLLRWKVIAVLAIVLFATSTVHAQTLVGNPFLTSYDGWVDGFDGDFTLPPGATFLREYGPGWGVMLGQDVLIENSDGTIGGAVDLDGHPVDGSFVPFTMIQPGGATPPANYTLGATFKSADDDGLGLVFGYQDEDNYFRVTSRPSSDGQGCFKGISVQKIVGGVTTNLAHDAFTLTPTDNTAFDLGVDVTGSFFSVNYGGFSVLFGDDFDLTPGGYGVFSWGQRVVGATNSDWGTQISQVTMTAGIDTTTHTFTDTGAVPWRVLTMTDSEGGTITNSRLANNFVADFTNGTIRQDSNGFAYASATAPEVDFLGTSVVVDDAASTTWDDYEMKVRLENYDNDGIGVLVRVQDDNNFYRINFCNEGLSGSVSRPPQGMSIQKCVGGVWTELYREDQGASPWTYTQEVPFDLSVKVDGNTITVELIDDPEGAATPISFPVVTDGGLSLMFGSVGLSSWGSGEFLAPSIYSPYGGEENTSLVVELSPQIAGDANGDGKVDGSDVTILADNWQVGVGGIGGATWSMGDFNGDGQVDGSDVTILADNWQFGVTSAAAAVPEPSTMILLLFGLVALGVRKIKRYR